VLTSTVDCLRLRCDNDFDIPKLFQNTGLTVDMYIILYICMCMIVLCMYNVYIYIFIHMYTHGHQQDRAMNQRKQVLQEVFGRGHGPGLVSGSMVPSEHVKNSDMPCVEQWKTRVL
jgi:cytochrome bd-type quinol oxidase subunit 2